MSSSVLLSLAHGKRSKGLDASKRKTPERWPGRAVRVGHSWGIRLLPQDETAQRSSIIIWFSMLPFAAFAHIFPFLLRGVHSGDHNRTCFTQVYS